MVTAGWHVRRKSLRPSVKKLGQEIKGKLGSPAKSFFTIAGDAEGNEYLGVEAAMDEQD